MKSGGMNRIMAMMAAAIAGAGRHVDGLRTLNSMGLGKDSDFVGSARNGGRRLGNAHVQRAARKARNVRRFRAQSRG